MTFLVKKNVALDSSDVGLLDHVPVVFQEDLDSDLVEQSRHCHGIFLSRMILVKRHFTKSKEMRNKL